MNRKPSNEVLIKSLRIEGFKGEKDELYERKIKAYLELVTTELDELITLGRNVNRQKTALTTRCTIILYRVKVLQQMYSPASFSAAVNKVRFKKYTAALHEVFVKVQQTLTRYNIVVKVR